MNEVDKLHVAAQAGFDLSTWAASINWGRGDNTNTQEWLTELRKKIERCQEAAKEAGIEMYGMPTAPANNKIQPDRTSSRLNK